MEQVRNQPSQTARTFDGYVLGLCPKDAENSFLFVGFGPYPRQRSETCCQTFGTEAADINANKAPVAVFHERIPVCSTVSLRPPALNSWTFIG